MSSTDDSFNPPAPEVPKDSPEGQGGVLPAETAAGSGEGGGSSHGLGSTVELSPSVFDDGRTVKEPPAAGQARDQCGGQEEGGGSSSAQIVPCQELPPPTDAAPSEGLAAEHPPAANQASQADPGAPPRVPPRTPNAMSPAVAAEPFAAASAPALPPKPSLPCERCRTGKHIAHTCEKAGSTSKGAVRVAKPDRPVGPGAFGTWAAAAAAALKQTAPHPPPQPRGRCLHPAPS